MTSTESNPVSARPARRFSAPIATYRLQLHAGLGFEEVRRLLPYLQRLGVSHLYFSPIYAAAPGSTHGYDVIDHNQVNPELGGLPALYRLGEEMVERDMGLIVDIVPNHVGIANGANPWWRDVLRYGPASRYASYFDIDWEAQPQMAAGKLVFPVLGQPFGAALESGEIRLELVDDDLALRYYEYVLPLAPRTYRDVVGLPPLGLGPELHDPTASTQIVEIIEALPTASQDEADLLIERFRALMGSEPALRAYVQGRLDELNGEAGRPDSFDALDAIHSAQHYSLKYWRVSGEEINYRRFFDINDLAGIRVEREEVFEETHRLVLDLVGRGIVTGLRIDHVDGLYDPAAYLQRLRDRLREVSARVTDGEIPIYVEKILEEGEHLPPNWPVQGTTGYDFMSHVDGVFVDRSGSLPLTEAYERFLGEPARFGATVYAAKRQILEASFVGETNVLAMQLYRLAQRHRLHRDNTLRSLRRAIEAVLACFPVYRTYVVGDQPAPEDHEHILHAVSEARRRGRGLSEHALSFLAEVLLLERQDLEPDEQAQRIHFRRRFQQLSGPVMAKGFEDTTLYRYNRLVSLNEVGSDPSRFGHPPQEVHRYMEERARSWPHAMSASSTHDAKRGEDVRARLHVLSELPREWEQEVCAWARLNRRHRVTVHGESAPDQNTEYLLYQTLVGSWPPDGLTDEYRERLQGYLEKAVREAKTHTSWTNPDERYESACREFLAAILDPGRSGQFLDRLEAWVERITLPGALNGLSALILKATAPGFPDFYQGTELWNLSLVDPDNRRPVDYDLRDRLLSALTGSPPSDLMAPEAKLWLTRRLLEVRGSSPELFSDGDYAPLEAAGSRAGHVFAFERRHSGDRLIVALHRLTAHMVADGAAPLGDSWADTALVLPGEVARWRDALTGMEIEATSSIRCAELFAIFPFAVLMQA